ncbi:NAD(P)H-hydrate dehydratase, partial [bacterium]
MSAPLTAAVLRDRPLPPADAHADKNTRGTTLVVGASATSAGAVTLSGVAAFRAGAGKVLLAVPQLLAVAIAVDFPEAGVHPFADTPDGAAPLPMQAATLVCDLLKRADACLIGPGLMDEAAAQELTRRVLEAATGPGYVIDALALTGLWRERRLLAPE